LLYSPIRAIYVTNLWKKNIGRAAYMNDICNVKFTYNQRGLDTSINLS